ncbi:MAG TPA: DinB family protein [Terriglobales bacterium]|nr:DinB family protein [Terriglobales bacterium]
MTIGRSLLPEFDREMANTRRMLDRVPEGKLDWSPHAKSSTLGELANHLALLPRFAAIIVHGKGKRPAEAKSKAELLALLDANVAAGRDALAEVSDEHLLAAVAVTPELSLPRAEILRIEVLSHMIHHRGQLSVYLRLLDAVVPGMYGPSADEKNTADRS